MIATAAARTGPRSTWTRCAARATSRSSTAPARAACSANSRTSAGWTTRSCLVYVSGTADKDDPRARQLLDDRGDCATRYRDDERYDIEPVYAAPVGGFTEVGFRCTRYMEPQVNAIGRDTDLVMLTIGGNDVAFADIVTQCFVVFVRGPGDCRDKVSAAQDEIVNVGDGIEEFLRRLKTRMRPDAKIALAAYPQLEKDENFDLRGGFLFTDVYAVGREVRELGRPRRRGRAHRGRQRQRRARRPRDASSTRSRRISPATSPTAACAVATTTAGCTSSTPRPRWSGTTSTNAVIRRSRTCSPRHPDISVGSAPVELGGSVDIAFLIDTTGSMGRAIASVKAAATDLVNAVGARTASARFALSTTATSRRARATPTTTRRSSSRTSRRARPRSTARSRGSGSATAATSPRRCTRASTRPTTSSGAPASRRW